MFDLEDAFGNSRKVDLKLKAKKCAFGVTKGHSLGCLIMPKGINPKIKIEAMLGCPPPEVNKGCPAPQRMTHDT